QRRHAKAVHQWLRAVVAGTNGDPRAVDDRGDVVRMEALDAERYDRPLVRRGAEDLEPVVVAEPLVGVLDELALVGGYFIPADLHHVVERRAEPDRLDDRRRAGLELVRQLAIRDAVHRDALAHRPAAEERRQSLEQRLAAPKHADAGR